MPEFSERTIHAELMTHQPSPCAGSGAQLAVSNVAARGTASALPLLLKLALAACERGDAAGAAEALRGALALRTDPPRTHAPLSQAVSTTQFAQMLGYSPRYIRQLVVREVLPKEAVVGSGRARRILVDRALEALRHTRGDYDDIANEGADHVRRKAKMPRGSTNGDELVLTRKDA